MGQMEEVLCKQTADPKSNVPKLEKDMKRKSLQTEFLLAINGLNAYEAEEVPV